ncbi:hypothetical protein EON65_27420 [archaeon]|nr:MAG: hypothetical protein EON65_27420 [archaeon]
MKELPPGRYKYRFVVDGVPRVDEVASQIDDKTSPLGRSNVLLVSMEQIFHTDDGANKTVKSDVTISSHDTYHPPGQITHISKLDKMTLMKRLESINLRNLALYDDGLWALASHIQRNNTIKAIDLSYNDISDEGIQAFAVCLPRLLALEVLKLNGNGFSVDSCRYITEQAVDLKHLATLELSNNRLGDDGMEVLCKFLRYNEVLQTLYIDNCYIGDDGMLCLQESLLINRKLTFISLAGNRIGPNGAAYLSTALHDNASLTFLNLNSNALQADGVKVIGNSIYLNDTLKHIYLDNVDLLHGRSTAGLHSVCYAIKRNRHLVTLSLASNHLTDYNVAELAHALTYNRGLETVNLSYNVIDKIWFQPNTTAPTHIMKEMPSIQTSLDKNILLKSVESFDYNYKSHIEDDVKYGKWSKRRLWKRIDADAEEKKRKKDAVSLEYERIRAEEDYLRQHVRELMNVYKHYLEEQPCKAYLNLTAKQIIKYFHDLPRFDSAKYTIPVLIEPIEKTSYSKTALRSESIKMKRRKSMDNTNGNLDADFAGAQNKDKQQAVGTLSRLLGALSFGKNKAEFNVNSFLHAHVSILTAVCLMLEGGVSTLMLQPERLEHAMTLITLPLPENMVQPAVDETIVSTMRKIAMHKLSDYILNNAQHICQTSGVQRARVLADLMLHPPVQEAKAIILHSLRRAVFEELRDEYRKENKPLFSCDYCHKRFATARLLEKHVKKGLLNENHRRYALEEIIQKSQLFFLQEVKHSFTGCFFPAYFELLPATQLPKEYYPQVFDKIGQGGRPIGVVEPFRTIKAIDVLGEYLHVSLRGQLGWVRYRQGNMFYLQPIAGFNWETLHVQDKVSYYRVNDNLPAEIELKIRHRPQMNSDVLGYLKTTQVVACLGKIDNWLQVRFENEDAGWIMVRPPDMKSNAICTKKVAFDSSATMQSERRGSAVSGIRSSTGSSRRSPSPIRKRRVGSRATPVEETEEDVDDIFGDFIVTYEIAHKKYQSDTRKNPAVNKYKIEVYDHLRYGDIAKGTHMDHLLLLPEFMCDDKKGSLYKVLSDGKSPWTISQQQLFDTVMGYSEDAWRQYDSKESGMLFLEEHPDNVANFNSTVHQIHEMLNATSQKIPSSSKSTKTRRGSIGSLNEIWDQQMGLEGGSGGSAEGKKDLDDLLYRVDQEDSLASSLEGDEGIESIY